MGATYMGAEKASYNLPRDYSKNVSPIFKHSQSNHLTPTEPQKSSFLSSECESRYNTEVHNESSTNGSVNGENGHTNGKLNGQVNDIIHEIKSKVTEKPISA